MAFTAGFSVNVGDPTKASDVDVLAANDDYLKNAIDTFIANDANNRVLTGTGSGTANAETNLTFDGSTLTVTGTVSATTFSGNVTGGTISGTTGTYSGNVTISKDAPQLIMTDSGSGGGTSDIIIDAIGSNHGFYFRADGATNHVILESNGDFKVDADTLFVDASADRVGINSNSPSTPLHVKDASTAYVMAETTGTSTSAGFRLKGDASADYTIYTTQGVGSFGVYDNANTAQRLTVDTSGNMGLGGTPVSNGTGSTVLNVNATTGGATVHLTNNTTGTTNSDGALFVQSGSDLLLINRESGAMHLRTADVNRITILSGGDVGLGTQSPEIRLSVTDTYNGSALTSNDIPAVQIINEQGSYTADNVLGVLGFGKSQGFASGVRAGMVSYYSGTGSQSSNVGAYLSFRTSADAAGDSTERVRITSAGNVGIGSQSPTYKLVVSNGGAAGYEFNVNGLNSGVNTLTYNRSTSAYVDSAHFVNNYYIYSGQTPAERFRVESTGVCAFMTSNVNIRFNGTASSTVLTDNNGVEIYTGGYIWAARQDNSLYLSRAGSTGEIAAFRYNAVTQVGSISVTSTATAYNTSSDYRLKENLVPITGAVDRVNALQPRRFNFISDPDTTVDGFVAHEVSPIVPESVNGEKDAVDEDGNPEYQGIDQSKLVPLLTAAIQELTARIEALEAS